MRVSGVMRANMHVDDLKNQDADDDKHVVGRDARGRDRDGDVVISRAGSMKAMAGLATQLNSLLRVQPQ
jgi:hypothetical protein